MRRRPGDEHALRLEQRRELLGGRGASFRSGVGIALGRPQLDEGIDRDGLAVGGDDQRVDVDAGDIVALGDHAADGHERGRKGVSVDCRLAAELAEQLRRRQVVDHLGGVVASSGAGRNTTSAIASAKMPPTPSITVGPNCGSRERPDDELTVALHHRGDEDRDVAVGRRGRGEEVRRGRLDIGGGPQVEADQAAFGLVGDRVAVELGHDGVADGVGRRDGLARAPHETLGRDRHPVGPQQFLGRALGESGVGGRAHAHFTVLIRPHQGLGSARLDFCRRSSPQWCP